MTLNALVIVPGLDKNIAQFSLLVLVNAFVGGMVGMERSILPQWAEEQFNLASNLAVLSFIIAFGLTKAIANYYTGRLANRYGRKRLLVVGWIVALPVPLLLLFAPTWNWVILANTLLGISQGFTWSSTVIMKIDLVGERNRGFAMGLNEFAGYFAVGVVAFATAIIAAHYGVKPYPFYLGLAIALLGLIVSLFWIHDTRQFVHHEIKSWKGPRLSNVFWDTCLKNKTLSSVTQAGLVNNLNDGMIWGLLPLFLLTVQFNITQIGLISGIYPTVWGISQLFTGRMADHFSKKGMLFWGMFLQALAIIVLPFGSKISFFIGISVVLGFGTALVYPTFLTSIAQATHPFQRAESIGTFRLWRDLGYPVGAILSGIVADVFGLNSAIFLVGIITLISALIIHLRMPSDNTQSGENSISGSFKLSD